MEPRPLPNSAAEIAPALAALRRGECIGLPTETVYGLAADAENPAAIARVYALKGRPAEHPLIIHIASTGQLDDYARDIPTYARALAARFWPGPLTLVLPRGARALPMVTGGQHSVALRMPSHPLARAVLTAFGRGLVAPSANRFGHVSPTRADHVRAEFGDALPVVLDGGPCDIGIESVIVDCTGAQPRILRPGMISAAAIDEVVEDLARHADAGSPRAPGMLERHYAPRTPVRLLPREALADGLPRGSAQVLALDHLPPGTQGLVLPANPAGYARGLYAALRQLDDLDADQLRIETPPDEPAWLAIHDRLRRAAAGR